MNKYFFPAILIVTLVLLSGCAQDNNKSITESDAPTLTEDPKTYSNQTVLHNTSSDNNTPSILSKCTDEEVSGTEEEIDKYLEDGYCIQNTKREGMYPLPIESLGSQKEIYTKGFCCKVAALPGRDF